MGMTINSITCEPVKNYAICGGSKDTDQIVIKTIINVTVTAGTPVSDRKITPLVKENSGHWYIPDPIIDNKRSQEISGTLTNADIEYETRIKCKQDCSMEGPDYSGSGTPDWTSSEKSVTIYSEDNVSKKESKQHIISCLLKDPEKDQAPEKEQVKEKQQVKE